MENTVLKCDVCERDVNPEHAWHPVFNKSKHGIGKDRVRNKYEEGVACCLRCAWQFSKYGKNDTEKKTSLLFPTKEEKKK